MSEEFLVDMHRLQNLLPGYVNSTVSPTERLYVKNALAQSAQARAALAWHEALAEKVVNDVDALPPDFGWTQLQAKVRLAGHAEKMGMPPDSAGIKNGWRRLVAVVEPYLPHNWLSAPALGGACALLLAVVAGQGYVLVQATPDEMYGQARGSQPAGAVVDAVSSTQSKYVQLNFRDAVSERDMRLLLVRTGAVIVGGPGQLGDYTVAVPSKELDQALTQFKESLLTESARVVDSPAAISANKNGSAGVAPGQAKP